MRAQPLDEGPCLPTVIARMRFDGGAGRTLVVRSPVRRVRSPRRRFGGSRSIVEDGRDADGDAEKNTRAKPQSAACRLGQAPCSLFLGQSRLNHGLQLLPPPQHFDKMYPSVGTPALFHAVAIQDWHPTPSVPLHPV